MMERLVKKTGDGSATLYVPALNEHYHSFHGALQESKHVFIDQGLNAFTDVPHAIHVLEIGLGTGLNAMLTAEWALKNQQTVFYSALEKYPVSWSEVAPLGYELHTQSTEIREVFKQLHQAESGHPSALHAYFQFTVFHQDLRTFKVPGQFDCIFFDAFAPDKQPDLWELPVFESMFHYLRAGGHLVTYCAKGSVKRALKAAGFEVVALPGPPGKREMTKAIKP